MPFCVECGKELNSSDKFCSACGKENAEYRPDSGPKASKYDIAITPRIRLYGPQDAKTEIELYIPQLGRNMYLRFPNYFELGQTLRIRGEGLVKPNGEKGDLLITPTEVEYYDTELTISARLSGATDSVSKIPVYLPHTGKTVQISVPNNVTVGKTLRLKGLGLDAPHGEKGDLYLHFDHIEYEEEQPPIQKKENSERKTVYEGELHKCPSCGEILNSFVAVCPSCGHEIRGAEAVSSVKELARKLEAIEAGRERKRSRSLKDRMYGEEITKTDEQKISLIRSFAIPNTKEDLYEFLILAGSNIDVDLYDGTVLKTDARLAVSDAWKAKFEQAYQKAKRVFDGDPRFSELQSIYDATHKSIKKAKGKTWKLLGMVYGILFAVIIVSLFIIVPMTQHNEEKRLNEIIANVETALDSGEYKLALMYADSIVPQSSSDDEFDREWAIQREYWIDKVINEASGNGIVLERPATKLEDASSVTEATPNSKDVSETTIWQDSQTEPIVESTSAQFTDPSEIMNDNDADDYSTLVIDKGSQYTYGQDEGDLYFATAISDSIIKIEKWGKHFTSEKSFDYEYEVGAFKITDPENGFCWIDDAHTAFSFILQDKSNGYFKKSKEIVFTILGADSDTNKGTNCTDGTICYSYQNDDWHLYKAVLLSESIVKIECWYRPMAFGSFHYGYDVSIVNLNDMDTDFEWTDKERTSFTITMTDSENSDLKKPTFVAFEKE